MVAQGPGSRLKERWPCQPLLGLPMPGVFSWKGTRRIFFSYVLSLRGPFATGDLGPSAVCLSEPEPVSACPLTGDLTPSAVCKQAITLRQAARGQRTQMFFCKKDFHVCASMHNSCARSKLPVNLVTSDCMVVIHSFFGRPILRTYLSADVCVVPGMKEA